MVSRDMLKRDPIRTEYDDLSKTTSTFGCPPWKTDFSFRERNQCDTTDTVCKRLRSAGLMATQKATWLFLLPLYVYVKDHLGTSSDDDWWWHDLFTFNSIEIWVDLLKHIDLKMSNITPTHRHSLHVCISRLELVFFLSVLCRCRSNSVLCHLLLCHTFFNRFFLMYAALT